MSSSFSAGTRISGPGINMRRELLGNQKVCTMHVHGGETRAVDYLITSNKFGTVRDQRTA